MTMNRRTALAMSAFGAAAGLIGAPRAALAQVPAAAPAAIANTSAYRFRVGDATVTAIHDGSVGSNHTRPCSRSWTHAGTSLAPMRSPWNRRP